MRAVSRRSLKQDTDWRDEALKKQIHSTTAVTWLVCGAFLLAWLVPVVWITWNSALHYLDFYEERGEIYNSAMSTLDLEWAERSHFPGSVEAEIWRKLAYGSNQAYRVRTYNGDSCYFSSDNSFNWQTAVAVYDGDGTPVACSEDYLFFAYDTEEYWENANADSAMNCSGYTRVLLDLDSLDHSGFGSDGWSTIIAFDVKAMRFTGVFDGVEFRADRVEYISSQEFENALYSLEPDIH